MLCIELPIKKPRTRFKRRSLLERCRGRLLEGGRFIALSLLDKSALHRSFEASLVDQPADGDDPRMLVSIWREGRDVASAARDVEMNPARGRPRNTLQTIDLAVNAPGDVS